MMNRWTMVCAFWIAMVAASPLVPGRTSAAPQAVAADPRVVELRAKLERDLNQMVAQFDGVMSLALSDTAGADTLAMNGDLLMPQASSIKIAVLLEVLRQAQAGKLRLEERVEVRKAQFAGGSGVLQVFGDGTSALSVRDLAALMMVVSDNTATNILIDRVGQPQVNATLQLLGFEHTRLLRRMIQPEEERRGVENVSTAREMVRLLSQLYSGRLLDEKHTVLAIELLRNEKPDPTSLRRGIPASVALASKPGSLPGVRCESGIVLLEEHPYFLSVMTTYAGDEAAAERAITDVSRRVYSYFDRIAHSNPQGVRVQ
jgi:beta-lactamase class A